MAETFHPHNHVFYPHYYSTYCVHDRHGECRRTCKTCGEPCLCPCHRTMSDGSDAPEEGA